MSAGRVCGFVALAYDVDGQLQNDMSSSAMHWCGVLPVYETAVID